MYGNEYVDYAATTTTGEEFWWMFCILAIVYLLAFAFGIADYVLSSIGLYKLAERRGISNAFLAWVPVANCWTYGAIAEEYDSRNKIRRNWKTAFLIPTLLMVVLTILVIIAAVVFAFLTTMVTADALIAPIVLLYVFYFILVFSACAYVAIYYIVIFKIFESTVPEKALKYTILSILVPLGRGICLFRCADKGYPAQNVIAENDTQNVCDTCR